MSHYTIQETGGHLPSVIASILLHMEMNQEEAYQKMSSILNKLVEIVQPQYKQAFLHDLTLCIMYMCKVEFIMQLNQHMGGEASKKGHKKYLKQNIQMVNVIDKLIPMMCEYHKEILNDPENNSDEEGLLIALDSYKNHLLRQQKGLKLGLQGTAVSDTNWNYIYSQKISTKTGAMYLLARLLCVTLQVIMYDAYQKSRMKFTKIIHEIIMYFFTQKDIVKGDFIHKMETEEIYKKITGIDIRNQDQLYTLTFHHLFFRNDPKIFNDPIGIEWRNCEYSTFQLFEEFMSHQADFQWFEDVMVHKRPRRYDKYNKNPGGDSEK